MWKCFEKNVEKICLEKTWINDLEEMKRVEKCQCGKKREKFQRKNITYLVVLVNALELLEVRIGPYGYTDKP
jgi:hypothetical protein